MRIYFALVLLVSLAVGCEQTPQQMTTSVSGSAVPVDIVTGNPIWSGDLSGTVVTIEGTNFSTVTTADGRFVLNDVPTGVYTFSFECPGFARQRIFDFTVEEPCVSPIAYLYPFVEYQAEISDISLKDTTITKTIQVGVVVAQNGDTLNFGRDTVVTTFLTNEQISIKGTFRSSRKPILDQPSMYIFIGKTSTIDPLDTGSWEMLWTSEGTTHQFDFTDSTFELRIHNSQHLRNRFNKGENIFWTAYAAPWCYQTNGLKGRTAHLQLKNKTCFPTLQKVSSPTVPFIFPW